MKHTVQVLFVSVFAAMLGFGIIEPILPIYAKSMGASGVWIGIIFSAFMLSRAIFAPISGRLSDRFGRRRFILAGLLFYSVLSLAYFLAKSPEGLALVRFAHGITSALVVPVAMAYIGDIAPRGREGRYFSIFTFALFLGIAAGPLLGGAISQYYGIEYAFISMSSISLVAFVFAFQLLPETSHMAKNEKYVPYRKIFSDTRIDAILIFRAVNALGLSGFMAFFPLFAADLGISTMQIGLLVSANLFTLAILQPVFGKMADKHDRVFLVVAGTFVFSAALISMGLAHTLRELLAVNILMGTGDALSLAAATAMIAQAGKKAGMGSILGVFNSAMSVGHTVGPVVSGFIYGRFFTWPVFLAMLAGNPLFDGFLESRLFSWPVFLFLGSANLLVTALFYYMVHKSGNARKRRQDTR